MPEPGKSAATEPARVDTNAIIRATIGAVALLSVVLMAFAWPTSELEPRALPVAVAAPSDAVAVDVESQLMDAFGVDDEDALEVVEVSDRDTAISAIEQQEAYGAIVITSDGVEVLTASAASPVVAQLLGPAALGVATRQGATVPVLTDVVPTPEGDPRGAVFGAAALPLVMGGILVGAATSLLLRRDRLLTAVLIGAGAGLALAGLLHGLLGALSGNYWANAAVIALGVLAVALPIIGLHHLLGRAGIGIMVLLVMLVGNPLSGFASAPELLPLGWLGQLLPPGAAGTALRSTAFFDGAGIAGPLVVLLCWACAGLALVTVPRRVARRATGQGPFEPASVPEGTDGERPTEAVAPTR